MNVQIKQDDLRGGVTLANLFDKLNPKTLELGTYWRAPFVSATKTPTFGLNVY